MQTTFIAGAIQLASRVSSTLTGTASDLGKTTAGLMANRSLVDVSNVARVEPIVLLDADCVHIEAISDIMQTIQSMFAGYYLQAVNMVGTIDGVSVASKLAPLNPNMKLGFEHLVVEAKQNLSLEDYKHKLPLSTDTHKVALEDISDKTLENYNLSTNLSVGKLYNVTIKGESSSATIPVSIRLLVNVVPSKVLSDLMSYNDNEDMDLRERYHAWKSGRIEFVKDLILCNDLIAKRKKAAISASADVLSKINVRQSSNIINSLLTGKASMATASNIVVISAETLEEVEMKINGKLSNSKVRSAIFDNTNLMLLVIVDKSWERVEIFTRGIDSSSNLSFKDVKMNSKSNTGVEVSDILKAYMSGSSI